jgi:hypothetical protein
MAQPRLTLFSPSLGDVEIPGLTPQGFEFGSGGAIMGASGDFNVQPVAAGRSPASTAADIVVAVFSIPAKSFDQLNRGVDIQAQGSFVNNANGKTVKIIWGATTAVVGSAVIGGTTIGSIIVAPAGGNAANSGGWQLMASVFKYGAAGSNTQLALHQASQSGSTPGALLAPSLLTSPENAPILVAVTANAGTTATDIVFNFLQMTGMN